MQPLAILLGSQFIIAITTISIFVLLLISYKFKLKKYVYYLFIIISIVFLSNFFVFGSRVVIILLFVEFLIKSFSLVIIGSFSFNSDYLKKYFFTLSLVNFFALTSIVILGLVESIGYMRFGYAMLPTVLVSIYALYNKHGNKYKWIIIAVSSFLLIIIYGSRGPLLGLLIFIFITLLFNVKLQKIKRLRLFVFLIISYCLLFVFNGFIRSLDFLYYNLNLRTYSIVKLRMMFEEGLTESSSGRDSIYNNFLNQIEENPIFGNGVGISQELWGITPHNMVLQILLEFGVIGLGISLVLGIIMIYVLYSIRKFNNDLFLLLTIILSVSLGRLLVSSDIWLRQELWLFISLSINSYLSSKHVSNSKKSLM